MLLLPSANMGGIEALASSFSSFLSLHRAPCRQGFLVFNLTFTISMTKTKLNVFLKASKGLLTSFFFSDQQVLVKLQRPPRASEKKGSRGWFLPTYLVAVFLPVGLQGQFCGAFSTARFQAEQMSSTLASLDSTNSSGFNSLNIKE